MFWLFWSIDCARRKDCAISGILLSLSLSSAVYAETWLCRHESPDHEDLTFMPQSDGTVTWQHQKLGTMDPLKLIVNSDGLLTMATQRLNILYSRFFHLDKFSGRMGETTFRGSTLRRLAEKDPELNWDMVTTLWKCEQTTQLAK
jgi:hypothetical protein